MRVPVAFFIFNRPETTEKVFETIRQVQPNQLLVVADGSRTDRPGETEQCAVTRAIIDRVDWDCQVFKNYSDLNLGCKQRITTGLDWVFNTVEKAIILEDDCLPNTTFFRFCEELLERYQDDMRIMSISGSNLQLGNKRTEDSYYFSRYFHCWGWATWRRVWQCYDLEMKLWSKLQDNSWLEKTLMDPRAAKYWEKMFQAAYDGSIDTWAYPFLFTCWAYNYLNIIPSVNLVSNLGFDGAATHTTATKSKPIYAEIPSTEIAFPLQHPKTVLRHVEADRFTQNTIYDPTLFTRVKRKLKRWLDRYTL